MLLVPSVEVALLLVAAVVVEVVPVAVVEAVPVVEVAEAPLVAAGFSHTHAPQVPSG